MAALPKSGIELVAQGSAKFLTDLKSAESAVNSFRSAAAKPTPFGQPDTRSIAAVFNRLTADAQKAGNDAGKGVSSGFQSGLTGMEGIVSGFFLGLGNIAANAFVGTLKAGLSQVGDALGDSISFEQQIQGVAAVGQATAEQIEQIEQAVTAAAVNPNLSVGTSQAASAAELLIKNGLSIADATGEILTQTILLENATSAGTSGLAGYGEAADAVSRSLILFNLQNGQAGQVADQVSGVLQGSLLKSVNDYNYALVGSAGAISTLGLDLTQFNATIVATSNAFSSGRTFSTSFQAALAQLAGGSDASREALQTLGISAFDAQGEFVGLVELQAQLQAVQESGVFTTEALSALYTKAFGSAGREFAVAFGNAKDFQGAIEQVTGASVEMVAAIRTDSVAAALATLGDTFSAVRRQFTDPLLEPLQGAIVATSALLSALVANFAFAGQYIANVFSSIAAGYTSVVAGITGQITAANALTAAITGQAPTAASQAIGPQPRPTGAQAAQGVQDGRAAQQAQATFGRAQLDAADNQKEAAAAAKGAAKATRDQYQALESALGSIEGVFKKSAVTDLDLKLAEEGLYTEKADEFLRQLGAAAASGGEEFGDTVGTAREALARVGVTGAQDLNTLYAQTVEAYESGLLFYAKENLTLINGAAIEEAAAAKAKAEEGRRNVVEAFGGLVEGMATGASEGYAGAGGTVPVFDAAAAAAATNNELAIAQIEANRLAAEQAFGAAGTAEAGAENKFIDPASVFGDQPDAEGGGLFGALTKAFDTLEERIGVIAGIFDGVNTTLETIASVIEGQDFVTAGAAVSATLTTVLDTLSGAAALTDAGDVSANISSIASALLGAAGEFVTGLDATQIGTSAGTFATEVVTTVGEAVAGVELTQVATDALTLVTMVTEKITTALLAADLTGVGTAAGIAVNLYYGKLSEALADPGLQEKLTTAISTATTGIGTYYTEILNAANGFATEFDAETFGTTLGTLATTISTSISTVVSEAPLTEVGTAAATLVTTIGSKLTAAINAANLEEVGLSIGDLFGTVVDKLTATLNDPELATKAGEAVGALTGAIVTAVQGGIDLLTGAFSSAENANFEGLYASIGTFFNNFVTGFKQQVADALGLGGGEETTPATGEDGAETGGGLLNIDLGTVITFSGEYLKEVAKRDQVFTPEGAYTTEESKRERVFTPVGTYATEEADRADVFSFTGTFPDLTEESTALGTAVGLYETYLSTIGTAFGSLNTVLAGAAAEDGGVTIFGTFLTGLIDGITSDLEGVDFEGVGGALTTAVGSILTLFTSLSEIAAPDLAAITASLGGFVVGIGNAATELVGGIDGESLGTDVAALGSSLVTALTESIKAVPLAEIGGAAAALVGGITQTLRDAFTFDNLATVGESLGGLVTGIITQLTDVLSNPEFGASIGDAFGDLVVGIFSGISGLLAGFNDGLDPEAFAGIGDAIFTFLTSFTDGLVTSVKEVKFDTLAQELYDAITGAVSKLFTAAEGTADAIFGFVVTGVTAQLTLLKDELVEFFKGLNPLNLFGGFGGGEETGADGEPQANPFSDTAIKGFNDAKTAISGYITSLSEGTPTLDEALGTLVTSGTTAGTAVDAFIAAGDKLSGAFTTLKDNILGIFAQLGEFISAFNILDYLPGFLGGTPEQAEAVDPAVAAAAAKAKADAEQAAAERTAQALQRVEEVAQRIYQLQNPSMIAVNKPDAEQTATQLRPLLDELANLNQQFPDQVAAALSKYGLANPNANVATPGSVGYQFTPEQAAGLSAALDKLGAQIALGANANGDIVGQAINEIANFRALNDRFVSEQAAAKGLSPNVASNPDAFLAQQAEVAASQAATNQAQAETNAVQGGFTPKLKSPIPPGSEDLAGTVAITAADALPVVITNPVEAATGGVGADGRAIPVFFEENPFTALQGTQAQALASPADQAIQTATEDTAALTEEQLKIQEDQLAAQKQALQATKAAAAGTGEGGGPLAVAEAGLAQTLTLVSASFTSNIGNMNQAVLLVNERLDTMKTKADQVLSAFDEMIDGGRNLAGAFNDTVSKVDNVTKKLDTFAEGLAADGVATALDNLVDALDGAKDAIEEIANKIGAIEPGGGEDETPTPPGPDPTGTMNGGSAFGPTLVGEAGREIAFNPDRGTAEIVGQGGPEIKDFSYGTRVIPHSETERILARSGGDLQDAVFASAARGIGNSSLADLLNRPRPTTSRPTSAQSTPPDSRPVAASAAPPPITLPPVSIPQGDDGLSDEGNVVQPQVSSNDFFSNPLARAFFNAQGGIAGNPFAQVAQAAKASGDVAGALDRSTDDLVRLFNRPLFGGRTGTASNQVNVNVTNTVDNSTVNNTYAMGGVTTQRPADNIIDQFKLLKTAFS